MTVERMAGVVLDDHDADYLARALDLLRSLMPAAGMKPTQRLESMIDQLRGTGAETGATRPKTDANARVVDTEHDSAHSAWHAVIDTGEAAGILGITPNGVRDLARRKSLPARRTGRGWLLDAAAVVRRAESGR